MTVEVSLEPSAFWQDINQKNRQMIEADGLENFKRTVSMNYFNWLIIDHKHPYFTFLIKKWLRAPDILPFLTSMSEMNGIRTYVSIGQIELSAKQKRVYRLYTTLVWSAMKREDKRRLRFKVDEPALGNPIRVMSGKRIISQDLATSIIETNTLADALQGNPLPRIGEVGGGYGRLAYVYVLTQPGQYFIFDIPPALNVAEWYLKQTLGPDNVFSYRPFDKFADVEGEMNKARVVMLAADQITKFPNGYFDLMLSISTLPEMKLEQAQFYLSEFQRLSRSRIFLKQWRQWKNPEDGTELYEDAYELGPDWQVVLNKTDPVIPHFFNKMWTKRRRLSPS
jgi:putative sugar O-methyltransferase